jgi:IS30 family transposase
MSIERELQQLVKDVCSDDARRALAAYRRLSVEHLPWLERRAVLAGRRQRYSWAMIGRLLGRSRQSVQQRFDRSFTPDELMPPSAAAVEADLIHRYYSELRRDLARDARVDRAGDDGFLVGW